MDCTSQGKEEYCEHEFVRVRLDSCLFEKVMELTVDA